MIPCVIYIYSFLRAIPPKPLAHEKQNYNDPWLICYKQMCPKRCVFSVIKKYSNQSAAVNYLAQQRGGVCYKTPSWRERVFPVVQDTSTRLFKKTNSFSNLACKLNICDSVCLMVSEEPNLPNAFVKLYYILQVRLRTIA